MKSDALTAFGLVTTWSAQPVSSAVAGPASPAYPPTAQPIPVGTRLTTTSRPLPGTGGGAGSSGSGGPAYSVTSTTTSVSVTRLTNHRNGVPVTTESTAASRSSGCRTESRSRV